MNSSTGFLGIPEKKCLFLEAKESAYVIREGFSPIIDTRNYARGNESTN
jgi:hypothetical protein